MFRVFRVELLPNRRKKSIIEWASKGSPEDYGLSLVRKEVWEQ